MNVLRSSQQHSQEQAKTAPRLPRAQAAIIHFDGQLGMLSGPHTPLLTPQPCLSRKRTGKTQSPSKGHHILLGSLFEKSECFHARDIYVTGISYTGKKQTNPGIPLHPRSPHSVFPSPRCRERPALKAQVFVPKASRSRPGHKADRFLQTLSSQRNETTQAGPSS